MCLSAPYDDLQILFNSAADREKRCLQLRSCPSGAHLRSGTTDSHWDPRFLQFGFMGRAPHFLWASCSVFQETETENLSQFSTENFVYIVHIWKCSISANMKYLCSFSLIMGNFFAGEAISAGWCFRDCGWKTERMLWRGKHEEDSYSCCKVCGERCFTEANYCRGPFRAQGSLQHPALLSLFHRAHELAYTGIREVKLFQILPQKVPFPFPSLSM